MLYNLYKSVYLLDRSQKEYLNNSFDDIVASMKDDNGKMVIASNIKEAKIIAAKNNVFKEVLAGGLHDPETPEEMGDLINLLEKFIGIDGNFSRDNIGVFINPMSIGAKKITLRPCKIVGLMRKLDRLSRKFKNNMNCKDCDTESIRQDFNRNLGEVKTRLNGFKAETKLTKKH